MSDREPGDRALVFYTEFMRIAETVMYRELDDEIVILDLKQGQYFSLDGVGTRFWQLIDSGQTLDAAVKVLLREYDIDEASLRVDLDALVSRLENRGILID